MNSLKSGFLNKRQKTCTANIAIAVLVSVFFIVSIPITILPAQEQQIDKQKLRIPGEEIIQIITLKNGSKLMGRIREIKGNDIVFATDMGELTIKIETISDIKEAPLSSLRGGEYWFPNPNATRLFFAPTGKMLKKGEGYFSDYFIFFPGVVYGLSDNVSIGGGMSLIPGLGLNEQIFYFTPKIGIKAEEKLNIAAGALIIKIPDSDDDDSDDDDSDEEDNPTVGIAYGVGSFGTADALFTVGLGYGFVDSDFADKPMVMLGGEKRLTKRIAFVSENWIFPGVDDPLISYGLRFMGEKLTVDFALFKLLGMEDAPLGFPYLDFVVRF
ncbi:hypothetical protein ACFL5L_03580 [candidate division KSB1 bacterium]